MKILLIMFASLLVVPVASAAEMPKELRGEWCQEVQCKEGREDNRYVKCDEFTRSSSSVVVDIDRSVTFLGLDSGCTPIKMRKLKFLDTVTWLIKQRCTADDGSRGVYIHNYTRKGDYLYFLSAQEP